MTTAAKVSADFVVWIERKLEQHGVTKVLPDRDALPVAYRRGFASEYVASRFGEVIETAQHHADEATVPDDLSARGGAHAHGSRTRWSDSSCSSGRPVVRKATRGPLGNDRKRDPRSCR